MYYLFVWSLRGTELRIMWGWQGPLSPSFLYRLHMQLLPAFPTLHSTQSSKPCTEPPFLEKQTHHLFFIEAVGLQEPSALMCACTTQCQWEIQPFTCRFPSCPHTNHAKAPEHNQVLIISPVKSHFIYSWSALRTKKHKFHAKLWKSWFSINMNWHPHNCMMSGF